MRQEELKRRPKKQDCGRTSKTAILHVSEQRQHPACSCVSTLRLYILLQPLKLFPAGQMPGFSRHFQRVRLDKRPQSPMRIGLHEGEAR